jgi:hypothetical protein
VGFPRVDGNAGDEAVTEFPGQVLQASKVVSAHCFSGLYFHRHDFA